MGEEAAGRASKWWEMRRRRRASGQGKGVKAEDLKRRGNERDDNE